MRLRLQFRWTGILLIALATTLYLFAQQPTAPNVHPAQRAAPKAPGGRGGRSARRAFPNSYPTHPQAPPAEIAHGKQIFEANCSFCHGSDARGGETGPNLIISQVVLDDQNGERIAPIVHSGFPAQGMPKFNLSDADIRAIAAYLHSQPLARRGVASPYDILVGNVQDGQTYFKAHCTTCHSATGDLAGIGAKYDAKTIQNLIVSGGGGRSFGRGGPALPPPPPITAAVTLPSGQTVKGKLVQVTPFVVSLTEADGTYRTFARNGTVPKVVIHNPLQWHIDMLPKWNDTDIHNLTSYLVTLK